MHYYQFSIGDYRAATAHLSNEEDLAYRRLLDMYYDTEQKIPLDTQWVSRRLRVDAHVVSDVLNDMFVQHEDGWFHARCDDVIQQYHAMAEKNRANGRLGGRKKNPVGSESQPIAKATINQELLTINKKPKGEMVADAPSVWPEWMPLETWRAFIEMRKKIKKPPTEKAVELLIAKLKKFKDAGQDVQAILEKSITSNWQDVFEIKENKSFAQQAADIARTTVPAQHSGPDPVLLKIEADRQKAAPMPDHIRQQINQVLRKV
jgi:uncharacterized protein YdaU (DUF1376 family)